MDRLPQSEVTTCLFHPKGMGDDCRGGVHAAVQRGHHYDQCRLNGAVPCRDACFKVGS